MHNALIMSGSDRPSSEEGDKSPRPPMPERLDELRAEIGQLRKTIADMSAKHRDTVEVLRTAEARLAESLNRTREEVRDKTVFFASINHELRTPLNAIVGYSEALQAEMLGPLGAPKYREFVVSIHDAAMHLLGLANDLMDLARAEVGEFRLDVRLCDPGETIRSSVAMLEGLAENAGVTLRVDIERDLPVIHTDQVRLRQMVLNLTSNAIKFTPRGGKVTVKAKKESDQDMLILAVCDNGTGMSPEDLQLVLRPFGQIRRPTSTSTNVDQGAGLGLPITRRLAELMGGSFDIASRPGFGTIVTIRLPLRPAVLSVE